MFIRSYGGLDAPPNSGGGLRRPCLAFCGCGQGHQPVYPVHGEVRVGGQAPTHAMVTFHPVAGDSQGAVHPTGQVDEKGGTLTSYASGDGLPASTESPSPGSCGPGGPATTARPPTTFPPATPALKRRRCTPSSVKESSIYSRS